MAGSVIVDTSLALKWVLLEPYTLEAHALLARWEANEVARLVPALFAFEAANVLYRQALRGDITLDEARGSLNRVLGSVTTFILNSALVRRGMEIALELRRPAVYDSQYAALAEREGCELWTADERFWNAARARFPWVRWVGQHAAGGTGVG